MHVDGVAGGEVRSLEDDDICAGGRLKTPAIGPFIAPWRGRGYLAVIDSRGSA